MAAMNSKCSDHSAVDDGQSSEVSGEICGGKGFMLFGVRVMMEGSFRKSASMNNLAQFDQLPQESTNDAAAGYASDDVVHPSGRSRERKRGVPWSEEEHRLFLLGLQKVGKGDWRGISRNYVKTRTPTQVASHAQKYFLRRNNHNRRRRRSSLFDITTEVVGSSIVDQMHQETSSQTPTTQQSITIHPEKFPMPKFPVTITPVVVPIVAENPIENLSLGQVNQMTNSPKPIRPIPILPIPPSSKMANLNLNKTMAHAEPPSLSLNLSMSSQSPPPPSNQEQPSSNQQSPRVVHASAFQAVPATGFNGSGGDSMISVA
ncbi:hypothetical protein ACS0TY_010002 [Phlomoides rotata]